MARQQLSDLDFNNQAKPINLPAPTAAGDAATKGYVDSAIEGLAWKDNVRVASVANVTISGPGASINGIAMVANDRVLLKDQTAPAENGIYIWNGAAVPMTRALDASTFDELEQAVVTVDEGTSAGATFRQSAVNGTLGTTAVTWGAFGTAAASATETVAGVAEIATQAEVDAGTDDQRFVTPAKLKSSKFFAKTFAQTVGDGSATSFNIDHNFNTRDVVVEIYRNSGNFDTVMADVTRPSLNRVTVAFASAPAASAFRVVVTGIDTDA